MRNLVQQNEPILWCTVLHRFTTLQIHLVHRGPHCTRTYTTSQGGGGIRGAGADAPSVLTRALQASNKTRP
jgi:hypothetical protein